MAAPSRWTMLLLGLASLGVQATEPDACRLRDAPPSAFVLQVPFEVVDGRVFVQARVNHGGPFRFAVDTGASGMARADAGLVSALGLRSVGTATNSDGISSAETQTVLLDSLELGGLERSGLEVIARDYNGGKRADQGFSGIIGREFFADGLLVVDYPRRMLRFSRSLGLAPADPQGLAYERAFRVPIDIAGVATTGKLDTGANVAFVLPKALHDQVSGGPLLAAGAGTFANNKLETGRARVHGPFRIDEASLSDQEVRVSDRYPEVLVGAHVLQAFALMIDQRSQRIVLCR